MAATFAALEARVNAAVVAHLANATADFGGGVLVDGVFDAAYVAQFSVESAGPVFSARDSDLPGIDHTTTLIIRAVTYRVVSIQPDGTGMTRLLLERS